MKGDHVVLVDEHNQPIGTVPKLEAHSAHTPLHRGFSVFLFDTQRNLLLQKRSRKKKTWPLVWSNSCCGHPQLDESTINAAKRRLAFELGITKAEIRMAFPNYRYRFEKDGIVENELCPVMIAFTSQKPRINSEEVEAIKWAAWKEWLKEVKKHPEQYSPWCIEQTLLLSKKNNLFS